MTSPIYNEAQLIARERALAAWAVRDDVNSAGETIAQIRERTRAGWVHRERRWCCCSDGRVGPWVQVGMVPE